MRNKIGDCPVEKVRVLFHGDEEVECSILGERSEK